MTQAALAPARWAVVEQLQRYCANRVPNSFEFEVADHAISLILNPSRPMDAYFTRNAWRDARSVVIRQQRRRQARFMPVYGCCEDGGELELSAELQDTLIKENGGPFDAELPVAWADAYSRLRAALELRNRYASACLNAWRDGEEEQETAAALGISRDYVKKLRRLIRRVASEMFSGDEWTQ